uniref:FAD/NAD(P)-binding domain-containing protein n=1 Tax=Chromera velia CCMP2878 TaxID=1169474 RepID=A0A0G4FZS2_9ALVE|eukprot:Cvel_3988.t1-p1 / transcript=Cvel_3988.t1 / gene=Cvel_3988 / organism=Chromera_velia_CCMP2878 / gene_product=Indole-3-pyruvate monooxygenase YUCCA2, putative / transcript_product=Indole-3-pyruvate monooxygenase YUCCA2, putative / location=Cvel_scaffold169:65658-68189(+) / protein_length=691 / sequence_SO=supercontig / SO=protein_coding / is_pseudo=false
MAPLPSPSHHVDVIIIGAGQAGLATAAAIRQFAQADVSLAILEKGDSFGSSWSKHYEGLHLNTDKYTSGLPFRGFRAGTPVYPSREDFCAYLDTYADHMDLRKFTHFQQEVVSICPLKSSLSSAAPPLETPLCSSPSAARDSPGDPSQTEPDEHRQGQRPAHVWEVRTRCGQRGRGCLWTSECVVVASGRAHTPKVPSGVVLEGGRCRVVVQGGTQRGTDNGAPGLQMNAAERTEKTETREKNELERECHQTVLEGKGKSSPLLILHSSQYVSVSHLRTLLAGDNQERSGQTKVVLSSSSSALPDSPKDRHESDINRLPPDSAPPPGGPCRSPTSERGGENVRETSANGIQQATADREQEGRRDLSQSNSPSHVCVVGFGNSGLDIAKDLVKGGVRKVTILQRSSIPVVPRNLFCLPTSFLTHCFYPWMPSLVIDQVSRLLSFLWFGRLDRLGLPPWERGPVASMVREGRQPTLDSGTLALVRRSIERERRGGKREGTVTAGDGDVSIKWGTFVRVVARGVEWRSCGHLGGGQRVENRSRKELEEGKVESNLKNVGGRNGEKGKHEGEEDDDWILVEETGEGEAGDFGPQLLECDVVIFCTGFVPSLSDFVPSGCLGGTGGSEALPLPLSRQSRKSSGPTLPRGLFFVGYEVDPRGVLWRNGKDAKRTARRILAMLGKAEKTLEKTVGRKE